MSQVIGPDVELDPGWVEAGSLAEASELARAGRAVAVTLPEDETEAIATAVAYAWAGATVFRTSHPAVRQALDMTEVLLGRRPPVLARRGLA